VESSDEHFYEWDLKINFDFGYRWPLNELGLPGAILRKVYGDHARRAFQRARSKAA